MSEQLSSLVVQRAGRIFLFLICRTVKMDGHESGRDMGYFSPRWSQHAFQ